MDAAFDATVCIVAADEVRAERAGARGPSMLAEREAKQLSQDEKASRATFVVSNEGTIGESGVHARGAHAHRWRR